MQPRRLRHAPLRLIGLALAAGLSLAACAGPPPKPALPPLDFSHLGAITFDAASVDVVEQYRAPMGPPHVDHLSPTTPAEAVRRWAADRLKAGGGPGTLRVVIKDARITEAELPRTQGLKGHFTKDQAQRYDGRIEVEIVGQSPAGNRFNGYTTAAVTRSVTVPEDISLNNRERTWVELTRQMVEDLNARLDQGIRDNLGPIIRY